MPLAQQIKLIHDLIETPNLAFTEVEIEGLQSVLATLNLIMDGD